MFRADFSTCEFQFLNPDNLPILSDYKWFLNTLPEAALVVDDRGEILIANEMARRVFKSSGDSFHAKHVWELIPVEKREGHDDKMSSFHKSPEKESRIANSALEAVRGDGTRFAIVIILRQITLACGSYTLAICQDVSEQRYLVTGLRNELDQERLLARTDPLTSIANIRSFRAELERSIERLSRYGRHFTLISIDLDNFKPINDDYGHAEGDKVLKDVGDTLKSGLRSGDFPARIGGDEFAVLLPDTDFDAARKFIPRLVETLENKMKKSDWPVTFSLGVVTFNETPGRVDKALMVADETMYLAKRSGKNRAAMRTFQ